MAKPANDARRIKRQQHENHYHHRINDGDRGGGKRDACNLRLRQRPVKDPKGIRKYVKIGREEAHQADRHARPEVLPHNARIDFRPGEEGQQDGPESGEEIHPVRDMKPDKIARDSAHHDFSQGDRNRNADRNQ
ncbi:MAG TPA: hypothetical protein VGI20_02965 [Rhizomicrobium sp.]